MLLRLEITCGDEGGRGDQYKFLIKMSGITDGKDNEKERERERKTTVGKNKIEFPLSVSQKIITFLLSSTVVCSTSGRRERESPAGRITEK